MSTVAQGRSDYPVKYKNNTGAEMPAFGIFKLEDGARFNGELIPNAELSTADGEEAIYVNSANPVADQSKNGNCRSCNDGPFWVRYNTGSAPANGQVVGPVSGETYVDGTGSGLVVIFKDTDKELVLCEKLGGSCACVTVHEIRLEGAVTSGTFTLDVTIIDADANEVNETLGNFNWDDTAAEVQTEYETHSEIAASGADIAVLGGPFPNVAVYIVFHSFGSLNRHQPLPVPTSSLVGTNARVKVAYMGDANWEATV